MSEYIKGLLINILILIFFLCLSMLAYVHHKYWIISCVSAIALLLAEVLSDYRKGRTRLKSSYKKTILFVWNVRFKIASICVGKATFIKNTTIHNGILMLGSPHPTLVKNVVVTKDATQEEKDNASSPDPLVSCKFTK